MKTILYNPIFINPQAYYVFPRLTRYLQPDNESTSEPANYIGTIEVKVIAYGDTALKRTYTNTDSIDLSEFKNTWIRISLFTKVGSCVLGEWKIGNMESDLPYIDPEVLASLKAVVIVGNKTNNDSDRAIVKNLVDPDNPFVISNAAYTEGSGYADKGSPYYGAFVTDGIDDLITSTKTVQEMLGGSNELTIVSMVHQVKDSANNVSFTNYIRGSANGYFRNIVNNYDKTGIYGYTSSDLMGLSVVNNILGDKNDYTSNGDNRDSIINGNFSVQGYSYNDGNNTGDFSSVAWYWTIIANKVLTTDQINQVIAYYNLDRCVEPTVLYDIKRQGLSNDTPDSDWYLKDFSKNGFDMSLFNFAKNGGSGVAAKQGESIKDYSIIKDEEYQELTIYNEFKFKIKSKLSGRYWTVQYINRTNTSYPVTIVIDKDAYWVNSTTYYDADNNKQVIRKNIPIAADTPTNVLCCGYDQFDIPEDAMSIVSAVSYIDYNAAGEITVEFIPSCKGGLITDGVNDFGKVTGMPIYKDYTFIIDRQIISIGDTAGVVASKSEDATDVNKQGAFLFEYLGAPNNISAWSFYKDNGKVANTDFTRGISYQSTYSYNGKDLTIGTSKDSDKLWLGTIRDNDSRFFNGAIYSLMSFPYSMSEFLIERQLKKHKLGTLYPDMVEFRPVIKSNVELATKLTFVIRGTSTLLNAGDYIPKDSELWVIVTMNNLVDELTKFSINGKEITIPSSAYNPSTGKYGFPFVIDDKSPQKIDITIDEYIRYEDIDFTDCYPGVPRIYVDDKSVTWGDKLKVGDKFTFYGNVNILPEMYNVLVKAKYNGEEMVYGSIGTITKSMAFTSFRTYTFDSNEPKCILSPSRLRIPNSSYKILGYIPDISGHSNHGKINNSAYAGMSGANGYPNNFNGYTVVSGVTKTDSAIKVEKELTGSGWLLLIPANTAVASMKLNIVGIPSNKTIKWSTNVERIGDITLVNGINEIPTYTSASTSGIYTIFSDLKDLKIEQIGEYEGAYCLDGVDDFISIPTLSSGGKQVAMKVNWDTIDAVLYDQRTDIETAFAIGTGNETIAYNHRNIGGSTYIDGILNEYILTNNLQSITHNIVCNNNSIVANSNVYIGKNFTNGAYAKMSLYDFMLFDDISTDEEILNLNKYIGIEPKVELPPYYWDTYGKTNFDEDKATIQQRGVAVGDYDLINYNHAYDKMSGYDGYEFAKFDNELDWYLTPDNGYIDVVSRNGYSITLKNLSTSDYGWYFQNSTVKEFITKDIPFKVKANKSIRVYWDMHSYKSNGENFGYVVNNITLNPNEDTSINLRHLTEEELTELDANKDRMHYLLWFDLSTLAVDEKVTIEMLPLYPNGLVYDGVEDFSVNKNIPIIDDFTVIAKRTWLEENISDKPFIIKGDTLYPDGNQNAFLFEYGKLSTYSFGQNNKYDESVVPSLISWATPTSYNGTTSLVKGSAIDTVGIDIAHATKMVLYKLILYPKTISLLEINFLKNLMEKDEIIDLTNLIFIQE